MLKSLTKFRAFRYVGAALILLALLLLPVFTTGCVSDVLFTVTASIDGEKWTGPIEFSLYDKGINDLALFEGSSVDYYTTRDNLLHGNGMFTGKMLFVYKSGGPEGARFTGITNILFRNDNVKVNESVTTPFYALDVGLEGDRAVYEVKLQFLFTKKGAVNVNATLNGQPWSGPLSYTVTGAETVTGSAAPQIMKFKSGDCRISYKSGGPQGAIYAGVTPIQSSVTTNQTTAFTMKFVTNKLNVVATLDGKPWEGPCSFIINPPVQVTTPAKPQVTPAPGKQQGAVAVQPEQVSASTGSPSYNGTMVSSVFDRVPNAYYKLVYTSGGPPGSRLESISSNDIRLAYGQSGTITLNFTAKGTVNINVLVDGEPYTGPAGFTLYCKKNTLDINQNWFKFAENVSSLSYSSEQQPGDYVVSYPRNLPDGAVFIGSSPDEAFFRPGIFGQYIDVIGTLSPGSELTFTFYYIKKGSVTVNGFENDAPWSGPCEFTLTSLDIMSINPDTGAQTRLKYSGRELPYTFTDIEPGNYRLDYVSGGPPDGEYTGITPSSAQVVVINKNTEYDMQFYSEGSITVDSSLRLPTGWDGVCGFELSGETRDGTIITRTGTQLPSTFNDLPFGIYTLSYYSGAPGGYEYYSIRPSDTLELTKYNRSGKFDVRFIMEARVVQPTPIGLTGADLSLSLVTSAPTVANGTGYVTFTITVTNNGPLTATGVQVTLTLNGVTYFSGGAPGNGTWNVGDLVSGASSTATIMVQGGFVNGSYSNTASIIVSGVTDPVPANNTASVTITVI